MAQANSRAKIFAVLGLSLLALGTGLVSSLAWFQANMRPLESEIVTGTSDLSIGTITGYKDIPQPNDSGYLGDRGSSITSFTQQTEGSGNVDLSDNDSEFNVPKDGDGYYLVVADAQGKYKYGNPSTQKFALYTVSNQSVIDSITFASTSSVRVYHYTNDNGTTVSAPLTFATNHAIVGDSKNDSSVQDISVGSKTYKVWLDTAVPEVVFEEIATNSDAKPKSRIASPDSAKNNAHSRVPQVKNAVSPTSHSGKLYIDFSAWTARPGGGNGVPWVHFHSGTNPDQSATNIDGNYYYVNVPTGATGFNIVYSGYAGDWDNNHWQTGDLTVSDYSSKWIHVSTENGWHNCKVSTSDYYQTGYYLVGQNGIFGSANWDIPTGLYVGSTEGSCTATLNFEGNEIFTKIKIADYNIIGGNINWGGVISRNGYYSGISNFASGVESDGSGDNNVKIVSAFNCTFYDSQAQGADADGSIYLKVAAATVTLTYVDTEGTTLTGLSGGPAAGDTPGTYYDSYTVPSTHPTKSGYTWIGWKYSRTAEFSNATSTTDGTSLEYQNGFTLYGVLAASRTVTFLYWDITNDISVAGTAATSKTVVYNSTFKFPAIPSAPSDDYVLVDSLWHINTTAGSTGKAYNTDSDPITTNSSFYIHLKYKWSVTFEFINESNGATVSGTPATAKKVTDGTTFTFPAISTPLPTGYRLYNNEEKFHIGKTSSSTSYAASTGTSPTISADTTFYVLLSPLAQYTVSYYKVYFYHDGTDTTASPESVSSETKYENQDFTLPTLPSGGTGYQSSGWYSSSACTGTTLAPGKADYRPGASTSLYCRIDEVGVTVTLKKTLIDKTGTETTENLSTVKSYPTNSWSVAEPSHPTVANYTWVGWFTAATGGTAVSWPHTYSSDATVYARYRVTTYQVTLVKRYFDNDETTSAKPNDTISNWDTAYATDAVYNPGGSAPDASYDIKTAGSWKHLEWDGNYYTDSACRNLYVASTPATRTLYIKYVSVGQTDFYVDSKSGGSGWNGSLYLHGYKKTGETTNWASGDSATDVSLDKLGSYLYRFRAPTTMTGFNLTRGDWGGTNQTTDIDFDGYSSTSILRLVANGSNSLNWAWDGRRQVNIGTAKIYKNGSVAIEDDEVGEAVMGIGDMNSNYFIYERSLTLSTGDQIAITVSDPNTSLAPRLDNGTLSGTDRIFGWSQADDPTKGNSAYYEEGTSNRIKVLKNARYNFYLTTAGQVAIAAVPLLGNGYYIMPSNADGSLKTGFEDSKKMKASSTGASYGGYYAEVGDKVFIRSYLDAVDKPYQTIDDSLLSSGTISVTTGTGKNSSVITFLKSGKYNIAVNASTSKVTITAFGSDDSFTLGTLKNGASIYDSYTSLVMEIPVTTTNLQPITLNLDISNPLNSFVGVQFYVSAARLANPNDQDDDIYPYTYMRTNYFSTLSNGSSLSSALQIASSTTCYAYILIDYTSSTIVANPNGTLSFRIRSVQV